MINYIVFNFEELKASINALFEDKLDDIGNGIFARKQKDMLNALKISVNSKIDYYCNPVLEEPKPAPIEKPPCQHKWRDIPYWYVKWEAVNGLFTYSIHEAYICIYCKKREDRMLEFGKESLTEKNTPDAILERLRKKYPNLRPSAVVEDMINDAIMVDRDYLRIVDILKGRQPIENTVELKL